MKRQRSLFPFRVRLKIARRRPRVSWRDWRTDVIYVLTGY